MAKRTIITIICVYCKENFETKVKNRIFCSVLCKNKQQGIDFKGRKGFGKFGAENGNFGKKWSEEKRKLASERTKARVDDEYRRNCSKSNKGVKFSAERVEKMHGHRTKESYQHSMSEETKAIIGVKSKEKFQDPNYIIRVRKIMEEKGHWIPKSSKLDKEIYYEESNWKKRMFDILYESKKEIIKEYGVYNSYKNTKGVVRDHMLSRNTGFTNSIFPELLRHVENCDIITHSYNVSKRFTKKDSITIEELFERIKNTNHEWEEQTKCLFLIEEYKNGKRWKRKEV